MKKIIAGVLAVSCALSSFVFPAFAEEAERFDAARPRGGLNATYYQVDGRADAWNKLNEWIPMGGGDQSATFTGNQYYDESIDLVRENLVKMGETIVPTVTVNEIAAFRESAAQGGCLEEQDGDYNGVIVDYEGYITPIKTGDYTFGAVKMDNGLVMEIDDDGDGEYTRAVHWWSSQTWYDNTLKGVPYDRKAAPVHLEAGVSYPFKATYMEISGGESMILQAKSGSETSYLDESFIFTTEPYEEGEAFVAPRLDDVQEGKKEVAYVDFAEDLPSDINAYGVGIDKIAGTASFAGGSGTDASHLVFPQSVGDEIRKSETTVIEFVVKPGAVFGNGVLAAMGTSGSQDDKIVTGTVPPYALRVGNMRSACNVFLPNRWMKVRYEYSISGARVYCNDRLVLNDPAKRTSFYNISGNFMFGAQEWLEGFEGELSEIRVSVEGEYQKPIYPDEDKIIETIDINHVIDGNMEDYLYANCRFNPVAPGVYKMAFYLNERLAQSGDGRLRMSPKVEGSFLLRTWIDFPYADIRKAMSARDVDGRIILIGVINVPENYHTINFSSFFENNEYFQGTIDKVALATSGYDFAQDEKYTWVLETPNTFFPNEDIYGRLQPGAAGEKWTASSSEATDTDITEITVDGYRAEVSEASDTIYNVSVLPDGPRKLEVKCRAEGAVYKAVYSAWSDTYMITVTSKDGFAEKEYKVIISPKSDNTNIAGVTVDGFAAVQDGDAFNVTAVAGRPHNVEVVVEDKTSEYTVSEDKTKITVTSAIGTVKEYALNIAERPAHTDATLSYITVDGEQVELTEGATEYSIALPKVSAGYTVEAGASDGDLASVEIEGEGNTRTITVTAEDETVTAAYTLTIIELKNNTKVNKVYVDGVEAVLTDGVYTVRVKKGVHTITAETVDNDATVEADFEAGTFTITAPDGETAETYNIRVDHMSDNTNVTRVRVDGRTAEREGDIFSAVAVKGVDHEITVSLEDNKADYTVAKDRKSFTVSAEDGTEQEYAVNITEQSDNTEIWSVTVGGRTVSRPGANIVINVPKNENLEVNVVLTDSKATKTIERISNLKYEIKVISEYGSVKVYTLTIQYETTDASLAWVKVDGRMAECVFSDESQQFYILVDEKDDYDVKVQTNDPKARAEVDLTFIYDDDDYFDDDYYYDDEDYFEDYYDIECKITVYPEYGSPVVHELIFDCIWGSTELDTVTVNGEEAMIMFDTVVAMVKKADSYRVQATPLVPDWATATVSADRKTIRVRTKLGTVRVYDLEIMELTDNTNLKEVTVNGVKATISGDKITVALDKADKYDVQAVAEDGFAYYDEETKTVLVMSLMGTQKTYTLVITDKVQEQPKPPEQKPAEQKPSPQKPVQKPAAERPARVKKLKVKKKGKKVTFKITKANKKYKSYIEYKVGKGKFKRLAITGKATFTKKLKKKGTYVFRVYSYAGKLKSKKARTTNKIKIK